MLSLIEQLTMANKGQKRKVAPRAKRTPTYVDEYRKLMEGKGPMGLAQLAELMPHIQKPTVHYHLKTLAAKEYLAVTTTKGHRNMVVANYRWIEGK